MDGQSKTVHVPPELPEILKQFTKAAINVHPKDVLAWSAAYFRALADGEPELREKLEGKSALTPGFLKVVNKQLGPRGMVTVDEIKEKWKELALPVEQVDHIAKMGGFHGDIDWMKFAALACSSIGGDIREGMAIACKVFSTDSSGKIPFRLFMDIYRYLAKIDGTIPCSKIENVKAYLEQHYVQHGQISAKDFMKSDVMTG